MTPDQDDKRTCKQSLTIAGHGGLFGWLSKFFMSGSQSDFYPDLQSQSNQETPLNHPSPPSSSSCLAPIPFTMAASQKISDKDGQLLTKKNGSLVSSRNGNFSSTETIYEAQEPEVRIRKSKV